MDSRITPQEKSKPISEAKDDFFNEVIKLRSEYIAKKTEHTDTIFDYTSLIRAMLGLVTHTGYYIPDSKMFGNKSLKKAIVEFLNQKSFILVKPDSIEEGLKLSEAYIIALQEESICSYK